MVTALYVTRGWGGRQVLARSSPDDKYMLVTRLNGTSLPRDREAWEEQHPQLDWDTHRDRALPGYWDEVLAVLSCSSQPVVLPPPLCCCWTHPYGDSLPEDPAA